MSVTAALVVSLAVDALEYMGPILFAMPIVGDTSDGFTTNLW
jgi:hypothetical protein